jgi:hypothetical protein
MEADLPYTPPFFTAQQIGMYSRLAFCSECGALHEQLQDPWIVLAACGTCGHIDTAPDPFPTFEELKPKPKVIPAVAGIPPGAMAFAEVQQLMIGMLRQVEGNKAIIDPAEFDTSGVTFYQHTNPLTGTVTIWFEKDS